MSLIVINPVTGGSSTSSGGGAFSGWFLPDSNGITWQVTVLTTGNLNTAIVSGVPSGSLYRNSIVTQDNAFNYWTITVSTTGNLVTTAGGSSNYSIADLLMNDSAGKTWVITVTPTGNLETE